MIAIVIGHMIGGIWLMRFGRRNYPEAKLQENLDSEIMEVLLQEARDSYDEEIVIELRSDTTEEMEGNVERIEKWVEQWRKDNTEKS
jgi:adenylate kinase